MDFKSLNKQALSTHLLIDINTCITYKASSRGVAQPGSASGLGPEGRRFKSCRPDQLNYEKSKNI